MDETQRNSKDTPIEEVDLLITRIVDNEASVADRAAFEERAALEPDLWRLLAQRQQEMAALQEAFENRTASAVTTTGPKYAAAPAALAGPSTTMRWLAASAGWAAVVALGLAWWASEQNGVPTDNGTPPVQPVADLTPDDHFAEYFEAPFVLGEMQPMILEIQDLSDGRIAVRYMRRIEEVQYLDNEEQIPVTEHGELTVPPAELRNSTADATMPETTRPH